jgi:amidase
MARDPLDLAHLLETLSGSDLRQPGGQAFFAADVQAADMSGKKIGWLGDWGGAYPYEAGISTLCEEALSVFTEMGAQVEAVAAPHPAEEIWDSWITLRSWVVAAGLEPMYNDSLKRERLKDSAIWEIERGLALSAMDVHRASVAASVWYRRAAELFTQYDALVLPSAQVWPFAADIEWMQQVAGKDMDTYHRWMEVVIPVSLIGLPAVNLPCGFGAAGLPMGMQMFGPRGADAALLSMAQSYHLATDWPGKRPPVL